ncbi:AI-2E family transporter [Swaminathania salitolerans]|uniref:AI-2E family transporter n=1 Tax=Swaminathania salitolerans TaxID=182838 RepID=A0A511BPH9_9PROT|nr:AI-2E family transporter [Swaminathania salitolerans]GBQ15966.1 transporter [Swaminathania salitolerans LMG 21291]GEL01554.1 AI-2E family transporter [Swaminathania salitolerans]
MPDSQPAKTDAPHHELSPIFRILRFTLIVTIVVLAVWLLGDVMMVVFAATLFAVVLHGLARILRDKARIPYQLAVGLVALVILAAIVTLIYFSGPQISDQFVKLKQALITQYGQLRSRMGTTSWGQFALDHLPKSLGGNEQGGGPSFGAGLANSVTGILSSAFGLLGTVAVILIAGLYFAMSPAIYVDGMLRLVPEGHRPLARKLILSAGNTLWSWTIGQAFDMLAVGLASGIGLAILGVPLAMALGVVAGLCNFIPYIGAIMGAIPAVLIALSQGTRTGLMVAGLYCVIQFLEGNVLAPFIQRHAVHMPPALAILSQTVFGSILGVPGLILASPLTAALLAIGDKATAPLAEDMRTASTMGETPVSQDG